MINGEVMVDPRSPTSPTRGAIREEAPEDPDTTSSGTRSAGSIDGEYFMTF